jgi:hypothetical protein
MKRETPSRQWEFKPRFRRHAFGWRSQPAIRQIKQAVSEIKKAAQRDPLPAGEGAVLLLERISPALENVDSSSGAIGTAVNNAMSDLIPIIAEAPSDGRTREAWLERLWAAHEADQMPYIEGLADHWGELCGSDKLAAVWADRLIGISRLALSPDNSMRGYFHGTSACLSALYRAERYQEIVDLLGCNEIWPYKRWAVKALAAMVRSPRRRTTPKGVAVHRQTTTMSTGCARKSCSPRGWSTRPIKATDWWPIALGRISAPSEPWPANIQTKADARFGVISSARRPAKKVNGSPPQKMKVSSMRHWRSPGPVGVIRGRLPALPATLLASGPTLPKKPGCSRWGRLSRAMATKSRAPTSG